MSCEGPSAAPSRQSLHQIAAQRTARREADCLQVYGTLQPKREQILQVLQGQLRQYGSRLPDLGQKRGDDVLARALEAGEFVDTIGVFNETALNRAVLGGELPTARLLLKYGADANYRPAVPWSESHGSILLDCVARVRDANKLRLTKELLQAGANVDFVDDNGGNVLSCAVADADTWRQEQQKVPVDPLLLNGTVELERQPFFAARVDTINFLLRGPARHFLEAPFSRRSTATLRAALRRHPYVDLFVDDDGTAMVALHAAGRASSRSLMREQQRHRVSESSVYSFASGGSNQSDLEASPPLRDSSQNPLQRAAADNQESPGGNDSQHHHLEPVNPYTGARHPQLADSPSHATAAANDQSDASGFHASTDYYVSFNTTENTPMTSTPMSSNASILGGSLQQQHEALPPAQPHAGVNRRINGSSVDWDSSQANSNNPTPDFAASGDSQNRPGPTDRSILAQRLQAQGQPPSRDGSTRSILSAGDSSVSRLNDISSIANHSETETPSPTAMPVSRAAAIGQQQRQHDMQRQAHARRAVASSAQDVKAGDRARGALGSIADAGGQQRSQPVQPGQHDRWHQPRFASISTQSSGSQGVHSSVLIQIPNVIVTPSFVAYRIELATRYRNFAVLKRYSTIWAFHRRLCNTFQALVGSAQVDLPNFPPKSCRRSRKHEFIETRRHALEVYFQELARMPQVFSHELVRLFLSQSDRNTFLHRALLSVDNTNPNAQRVRGHGPPPPVPTGQFEGE